MLLSGLFALVEVVAIGDVVRSLLSNPNHPLHLSLMAWHGMVYLSGGIVGLLL